jgi:phosphoribosylformylglycinamidine synthase subunit PurL
MKSRVDCELVNVSSMGDAALREFLKKNGLSLSLSEARLIPGKIGREPTLTELHIFNIEWSEHCSYKSSRNMLKHLPTTGPTVMQGPEEDAGILHLCEINGEKYGVVIGHESHNHPSQVVPYEGAATGVGGIIRDVLCMGARVVAVADSLRFGDPHGKLSNRCRYVSNAVVDGIAGYGNPVGIPILAGEIYFNSSFDENCLVNVACLGIIKEKDIVHSRAPPGADGYDIIIVGKATDNSGFGGAAFASLVLDDEDREQNRGAVQVPDPFLKNVLIRATHAVFREVREKDIKVGFKDMGAGGIMCSSSELCDSGGYGADIDLDKVHVSMDIPPYVIACSETQERFTWVVPPSFTQRVLQIYNEEFELPNVAEGARASVIGKVTKEKSYVLRHKGKVVCSAPVSEITSGIRYDRPYKEPKRDLSEPKIAEPSDYGKMVLKVLSHPDVASRMKVYKHYDTEVQGNAVIRPGEADAGVIAPIDGSPVGVALSTDGNPRYARIDPYWGAAAGVAEAMRNVAAVGAVPTGMTDCLNYGNPEKPESFWQFRQGVLGISDAAKGMWLKGHEGVAVPFVSGNVSFYNESATGKAVDPSAAIACVGVLDDCGKAITMKLKNAGSGLYLLGERKDELGGSVYYDLLGQLGANVPKPDFAKARADIYSVIDIIGKGLALSCHDISEGGVASCVSEMILGGEADGVTGAKLSLDAFAGKLRADRTLFSETGGFVLEIQDGRFNEATRMCDAHGTHLVRIGTTGGSALEVTSAGKRLACVAVDDLRKAWTSGLPEAMK